MPPFLRQQILQMMDLEENLAGLDSLTFQNTYKVIYDYPLEYLSYGFVNLYDLLYNGLGDSLLLTLDFFGGLRIASMSRAPSVSVQFKQQLKEALSRRPQGLEVGALPFVLGQYLDLANFGFSDLEELCMFMPDVCAFQPPAHPGGPAGILPASCDLQQNSTLLGILERETPIQSPASLALAMRRVLSANEKGFKEEALLEQHFKLTGSCLPFSHGVSCNNVVARLSTSPLFNVQDEKVFHSQKFPRSPTSTPVQPAISSSQGWVEVLLVEEDITWVRAEVCLDRLGQLEGALEQRYSKPGTSLPPEQVVVGLFVVCFHPEEAVWARGQVVLVGEIEVEVWMVDYAGLVRLPFTSIRRLLPQFSKLPAMVEGRMDMESKQKGEWVRIGGKPRMGKLTAEIETELKLRDLILAAMIKGGSLIESDLTATIPHSPSYQQHAKLGTQIKASYPKLKMPQKPNHEKENSPEQAESKPCRVDMMSPQGEANSELPELQPLSGKQPTQTISKRSGPDADNPNNWGVEETISKISSMDPSLSIHLGAFQTYEIDGKALVLLTTTLLMEHMQFKLGPALKISSIIEKLKGNKHLSHG